MKKIAITLASLFSLASPSSFSAETDPIYVGVCTTNETCSLSNMRKSLTSSGNNLTTYLMKNEINGTVNHYTSEFATSEFGQNRYIVRNKGAVSPDLADAVSDFVSMKENSIDAGLEKLGYVYISHYSSIGPLYVNTSINLTSDTLGWRISQMRQAISNNQNQVTSGLTDSISELNISGTLVSNKYAKADIGATLKFKTDGPTIFGVKDGPAIYVLKATKVDSKITIYGESLVLLDADGNEIIEVPINGYNVDYSSISGQFVGINRATQNLWKKSFLSIHIKLKDCSQLGCKVTITDPKAD